MILKDELLINYSGSCPIFPLPNFVMFPNSGNEFTIFEPRYIDMIEDVIKNERFIIMSLLKSGWKNNYEGSPPIYDIGTICYLAKYKKQKNSEFKIVLMGIEKVQINETVQTHKYRIGATTPLNEIITTSLEREKCENLMDNFVELLTDIDDSLPIDLFSDIQISLEMLVNLICMAMPIPAEEKQKLLELPEINLRYEVLLQFIDGEVDLNKDIIDLVPILPFDKSLN
ncbi:MAG: LON peptidase substrate-binding domain-containing protein [Candidatus Marinimicrobia bacterium]|nr:LON peptidase substrate-binding domain-containing protein [Candidatus Neomarinimicrobiota bacterium]